MRKRALWLLLLPGCAPAFSGIPAGPNALDCAGMVVTTLGYHFVSESPAGGLGSFTARKPLPPEFSYPTFGEITVSVWGDGRQEERIRASARRYEVPGSAVPVTLVPTLGPGIRPGVDSRSPVRTQAGRHGRRKLSAGPVAADAQLILHECGLERAEGRNSVASHSGA